MQHISFLALRHTVTPTNIFSNTFDNSVREWCFIASTNVNNAYEKAECVIYTASVINQAAVQLAGSGSDLVVVFPSSLKIMIINIDGKLEGGGGACVSRSHLGVCISLQLCRLGLHNRSSLYRKLEALLL